MESLFKGTTSEFRAWVPVTVNFTMDPLLPVLDATAAELLPRFLGEAVAEQISGLTVAYPGDVSAGELRDLKRALSLAQSAVAKIGFAAYMPFAEVQVGDDGLTVTAQDGRKAAFEYQTKRMERQLLESGWQAIDELVKLVAAQPLLFTGWPDTPYYQEHQKALFKSPAEFSKYYPIQDKWLTFWALRPFIQTVEEDRGETATGRIDALPNTVTDEKKGRLKRTLLRALAYEAVIMAVPNLSIEVAGANVQVNYASQYGNATYYQPPGREHLEWVLGNLRLQANTAWDAFESQVAALIGVTTGPTDEGLGLIDNDGHGLIML